MSPNLRKSQPNLSKPSEGSSFSAAKKPAEPTNPLQNGLNLTGERKLGTVGSIKSTARLTVGIDNLIGQQGLDIEIDATNRTLGVGVGIGSTRGKLGVNIGGKIGYDSDGNLSIKAAEAGINIGGFGGSASIDENEGIRGSVSIAGAKVEIGISPEGKKNLSLCYGVPGGELCVTFEPDPGIETTAPPPPTTPSTIPMPPPQPETKHTPPGGISIESVKGCTLRIIWEETHFRKDPYASGCHTWYPMNPPPSGGEWGLQSRDCKDEIWDFQGIWAMWDTSTRQNVRRYKDIIIENYFTQQLLYNWLDYIYFYNIPSSFSVHSYREEDGADKNRVIIDARTVSEPSMIVHSCNSVKNPIIYTPSPPNKETPPKSKIQLPNYPQHFKRMDCCDKVEEIYKYLGIAKLKKNKFPVSNAFLVPGGSGNDNCFDYYAIMQALFRMLANGLIINPKSKPLGTEWQNVNATAWASGMYEMMAESMSDGNSTQRFEVAAMMQLVQIMSAVAENSRKTEFITDAIGIEPLPVPEELPVCFTIYESHKGFGKKELKKINTSNLKTDDDVEKVLGKMLNPSKIPIVAWKFKPGQISINEALKNG